jgi:CheY-like chemotaxis protein
MSFDCKKYMTGLTCLVCEDDLLIRMNTVEMLEELGHVALEAKDATTALAILAEREIDLLVTDVSLPDLSGIVLVQRAKQSHPDLPVIFATGYGHLGMPSGMGISLLPKPFSIDSLANAIGAMARPA